MSRLKLETRNLKSGKNDSDLMLISNFQFPIPARNATRIALQASQRFVNFLSPSLAGTSSAPWPARARRAQAGRICLTLIFLLWSGPIALGAVDTHYVSLDGTNDSVNGYITWSGAATQIQWAVTAAGSSDTVLVSNGTYNLTGQVLVSSACILKSLYGTNDAALLSIINGNNYEGKLVTNRCVKVTANATVDGFLITNGYCFSNPGTEGDQGGAGVMINSAGTLRNCIVQDNTCTNTTNAATYVGGGGVFINRSDAIITNCSIIRNKMVGASCGGGGVFLFAVSSAKLVHSSLISNSAPSGYGGGAYGWGGTISNCDVYGNYANSGGGLMPGTLTHGCRIYNNTANSGGGIGGNAPGRTIDCVISNNAATNGNGGGVGTGYGCNFSNCVIVGNYASGVGGGLSSVAQSGETYRVRVANCTIYANKAVSGGGGVYCQYEGTFKNCLIYCNTNVGANGGGFYAYYMGYNRGGGPTGYIYNCTIVSNETGTLGGGIRVYSNNTNLVHNCIVYGNNSTNDAYEDVSNDGSNSNAYYNCCTPVILAPNQGNITNDPLFVDQPNRDYHLRANSPCLNVGSNLYWMTNEVDLEGRTRVRYGTVDMGAYELIISGSIYGFR